MTTPKVLERALRQYRHNHGDGFVLAYDREETHKAVARAVSEIELLKSKLDMVSKSVHDMIGKNPIACDGVLIVSASKYNDLVEVLNMEIRKDYTPNIQGAADDQY